MKRLIRYLVILLSAMSLSSIVSAQEIRDVSTTVKLRKDGSAIITQVWDVTVVSGTEWYMPITNLKNMYISDFTVSEDGVEYINEGRDWDVDLSLSEKEGRCGIVEKSDGVELCWGQGSYGDHVWTSSYHITGLVQSLSDYDAFNHQFVNPGLVAPPQHVSLTIINETGGPEWTSDNTKVWGFGFEGNINVTDGRIIAESTEEFVSKSSVIAMVRFDKGLFEPEISRDMSFDEMKDKAFTGSSYENAGVTASDWFYIICISLIILFGLFSLLWMLIQIALGNKFKTSMFGARKIKGWYRDTPLDGSLEAAWYVWSKGFRFKSEAKPANLVGAYFLKWILNGAVTVIKDPKKPKRVSLKFSEDAELSTGPEEKLYRMAMTASGDNILESREFKAWSKQNYERITDWPDTVENEGFNFLYKKGYNKGKVWSEEGQIEMRHVIEFRNFLNDFTLASEREAAEVGLWKDYMIYAQMFGIAEKVAKQFSKLYPDIMQECASSIGLDASDLLAIVLINNSMTSNAFASAIVKSTRAAAEGLGGGTSFGGGGGFSGGGFGGGSR